MMLAQMLQLARRKAGLLAIAAGVAVVFLLSMAFLPLAVVCSLWALLLVVVIVPLANRDASGPLQPQVDELRRGLVKHGYRVIEHERLVVGARVRNRGEQWHEAMWNGTATVAVVLRNAGSTWEKKYRRPDVEVIVVHDDGTVRQWANYGTDVAFDWADAQAVQA